MIDHFVNRSYKFILTRSVEENMTLSSWKSLIHVHMRAVPKVHGHDFVVLEY